MTLATAAAPRSTHPMKGTAGSFRCTLLLWLLCSACTPTSHLPEAYNLPPSVGLMIEMLWDRSSFVAAGSLHEIGREGSSRNWGSVPLYPCSGHFQIQRLIKGDEAMAGKKLLWYSHTEDCVTTGPFGLDDRDRSQKIWFLREDGLWLRPIVDNYRSYASLSR